MKKVFLLVLILFPCRVDASGAGAINMQFNTSARAAGMGQTGVAVPWGMDTNHWANPALLAFRSGVHYRSFESQLARGLADDIFLYDKEMTFGAKGVTVLLARGPLDGNYLDLGIQQAIDANQQDLGEFHAYARTKSWGVGVDVVQLAEQVLGWPEGRFSRYVSVAGGVTWHDFEDQLVFDPLLHDSWGSGSGDGTAKSLGYALRVTPYDGTRSTEMHDDCPMGVRVSLAYGASVQNKTEDFIYHLNAAEGDPFPRQYVSGWGLNAEVAFTAGMHQKWQGTPTGFFLAVLDPLLSFTRTTQNIEPGYIYEDGAWRYEHDTSDLRDENSRGWELGVANIYFLRRGHVEALYGDIDGDTRGGGWNIQAGRFGGFRKDWAVVPQATGLPTVRRKTWTVRVDPVEIVGTLF